MDKKEMRKQSTPREKIGVLIRPSNLAKTIGSQIPFVSAGVEMANQLGGFESGLTGQLFGPVLAVAIGGVGTIVAVVLVALAWPEIRRLRTLRETYQREPA